MKCTEFQKKMIFYIDADLDKVENDAMEAHLQKCEECRILFNQFVSCYRSAETEHQPEANPFLYTRIMQKIENMQERRTYSTLKPALVKFLQPSLFSLFLIVGISIGVFLGSQFQVNEQKTKAMASTEEIYMNDFEMEELEIGLINE